MNNNTTSHNNPIFNNGRIEEIKYELSECREDERCNQNKIVQIISIAGVVLGAVFSISFLNGENHNVGLNYFLGLYVLSDFVLCTAITFIVPLGIENVLRYHYIQDLEDRLGQLIPSGSDQKELIHWVSFSAPITTKNPHHLKSKYAWMYFVPYILAAFMAVSFCICITILQYIIAEEHSALWIMALVVPITLMLIALFVFIYSCIRSKEIYKYAFAKSIQNQRKRYMETFFNTLYFTSPGKSKKGNKKIVQKVFYALLCYLYPKHKDFQKSLLIIAGYITGMLWSGTAPSISMLYEHKYNMLIIWVVFEFLIYQARYQWNDVRGLPDDLYVKNHSNLPIQIMGKWGSVIFSLFLIFVRISVAFYIIIRYSGQMKIALLVCTLAVILLTIFYECARSANCYQGVLFIVCLGYPLRFFTGIWAAWPELWDSYVSIGNQIFPIFFLIILLMVALASYGEFSVALPWTYEAISEFNEKGKCGKTHFNYLYSVIEKRNHCAVKLSRDSLKEKGKLKDIWNITYFISLLCLTIIILMLNFSLCYIITELLVLVLCLISCLASYKQIRNCSIISILLIICKASISFCFSEKNIIYFSICACQIFFSVTYIFLRYYYNPDYNFFIAFFRMVVGKQTFKYLMDSSSSKKNIP